MLKFVLVKYKPTILYCVFYRPLTLSSYFVDVCCICTCTGPAEVLQKKKERKAFQKDVTNQYYGLVVVVRSFLYITFGRNVLQRKEICRSFSFSMTLNDAWAEICRRSQLGFCFQFDPTLTSCIGKNMSLYFV